MAVGLTSQEALRVLSRTIQKELTKTKMKLETSESIWEWIKDGFTHSSPLSTFSWTSAFFVMTEVIVFVVCFSKDCTERSTYLPLEAFILLIILFVNIYLVGWDSVQRQREMWFRAENIFRIIDKCLRFDVNKKWDMEDYPHLYMPQSPCISLQWTFRDGRMVNLPAHLLVEGDIIIMRPGHPAPGTCESLNLLTDGKCVTLNLGDFFVPPSDTENTSASASNFQHSHLRFCKPLITANFVMKETPYINALRLCLSKSLNRPTTLFNRERHTIVSCYLEKMTIPLILTFVVCVEALHVAYVAPERCHWAESLVLRPALTLLPLLPLALPTMWFLLNIIGVAYLLAMMDVYSKAQLKVSANYSDVDEDTVPPVPRCNVKWHNLIRVLSKLLFSQGGYLWRSSNLLQVLGSVTTFCCVDKKGVLSWPNPSPEKVFFLRSNNGEPGTVKSHNPLTNHSSSSNIHHYNQHQLEHQISDHHHHHHHHHHIEPTSLEDNAYFSTPSLLNGYATDSNGHLCVNSQHLDDGFLYSRKGSARGRDQIYIPSGTRVEVLDLTHNVSNDFAVEFDDPKWKKHLNSLKPLGLSILLNTCNPAAQKDYSAFCDHISAESLTNDAAVPVVNKRCLCELARQIGFTESAVQSYQLQELLAVFRHVQPDVVRKGRLARSLNLSRLKMPFPYLSCAVIKDPHTGSHQLFSQGTGDLLIDTCSDYWNGKGLSSLSESDRKRILDFYHRSSLTAYCNAFSYAPLPRPPPSELAEKYLELPPDSSHSLRHRLRSESSGGGSSPLRGRAWILDDNFPHQINGEPGGIKPYLSTDSLLFMKEAEEETQRHRAGAEESENHGNNESSGLSDKVREDSFLDVLSHQIFIGMVTMQYQACPDIVQLIELLDKSCIRFVHFSKENELRSRVFSEKMGLESGWNCHISLLSQRSRSESGGSNQQHFSWTEESEMTIGDLRFNKVPVRCVSAPSLLNVETFTVRFEDEVSLYSSQPSDCEMEMARNEQPYDVYFKEGANDYLPPDLGTELQPLNSDGSILETPLARNIREESRNLRQNSRRYSSTKLRGSTLSQSPSHVTESTDQSVPITFDISNRAKLPKGIENIRPHLDHVDNVPLLVSLFTDCTPEATKEMIGIMQDYGETVACFGSSANVQNISIFLQADVSIGMEPLFPQLCRDQPIFSSDPRSSKRDFAMMNGDNAGVKTKSNLPDKKTIPEDNLMSPTELSRHLNLLPCCFGIQRDDPISLYHLVMEARHLASSMQNSLQYMLCCCLSLTLLQVLSSLFFLPAPLAASHCIWLVCIQIPILSLSLVGNPCDPQGTSMATGKNLKVISKQTVFFFLGCYCVKFCPSIVLTCICFGVSVAYFCNTHIPYDGKMVSGLGPGDCWIFSPTEINMNATAPATVTEKLVWNSSITICQNLVAFLMVVYFVVISVGFVQRMHLLWDRNPFQNRYWALACIFVLVFQLIFGLVDIIAYAESSQVLSLLDTIPFFVWILAFAWPLPLMLINALIKRHEIKVSLRQQKRVRLEFCTKLGMNSPF